MTILYHGSNTIVEFPEIRTGKYTKDFYWGFYCTNNKEQAERYTKKFKKRIVSVYMLSDVSDLKIKKFDGVTEEWIDFIAHCRNGGGHNYDIVEGPLADDKIWNYVEEYLSGTMPKEIFLAYAKFHKPTHQISFHSASAISRLKFERSYEINE